MKAGDKETAKIIIENEIKPENRKEVIKYLMDLGFAISVKLPTPAPKPLPIEFKRKEIPVREQPREPPHMVELTPKSAKLHELTYVIPKEIVKELSLIAESEVFIASTDVDKEIANIIKGLDMRGIKLKIILLSADCNGLKRLGFLTARCYFKTVASRLVTRLPFATFALMVQPKIPLDAIYLAMGSIAGLTLIGLSSLVTLTLLLNPKGWTYTQLPWVLKASAITSLVSSFYVRKDRGLENAEVRVIDNMPFNYFIIDGKKAVIMDCPLTSKKPCLARIYKDGAYEALREFYVVWEHARSI